MRMPLPSISSLSIDKSFSSLHALNVILCTVDNLYAHGFWGIMRDFYILLFKFMCSSKNLRFNCCICGENLVRVGFRTKIANYIDMFNIFLNEVKTTSLQEVIVVHFNSIFCFEGEQKISLFYISGLYVGWGRRYRSGILIRLLSSEIRISSIVFLQQRLCVGK